MAPLPVRAANNSMAQRMLQGLRAILPATRHHLTPAYPSLTVKGLFRPLPIDELYQLNSVLACESASQSGYFSREGALLRIKPDRETVLVGDLHANTARLDLVLREYGPRLAAGEINLVFLGDIIHPENKQNRSDMRSSLETLNTIIRLKQTFPEQVHLLLGNHDVVDSNNFQMQEAKGNVIQSVFFRIHLSEFFEQLGFSRSDIKRAIAGYQSFLDGCPLAVTIEGYQGSVYAAHAGIVRGGLTRQQLVNARRDPDLFKQLLTNRYIEKKAMAQLKQCGRVGRNYTDSDIDATISGLGLSGGLARTAVILGHSPEKDLGFIYRLLNSKNVFVVHSNVAKNFGVVVVRDGVPRGVRIQTASGQV